MDIFELSRLIPEREQSNRSYLEFFRKGSLSVGLYALAAGAEDKQQPHNEDEVYYVVSGQAQMQIDKEHRAVKAGSVIFVGAEVEHRFHSIAEDLTILVFFAPAEYANTPQVAPPED